MRSLFLLALVLVVPFAVAQDDDPVPVKAVPTGKKKTEPTSKKKTEPTSKKRTEPTAKKKVEPPVLVDPEPAPKPVLVPEPTPKTVPTPEPAPKSAPKAEPPPVAPMSKAEEKTSPPPVAQPVVADQGPKHDEKPAQKAAETKSAPVSVSTEPSFLDWTVPMYAVYAFAALAGLVVIRTYLFAAKG